MKAWNKGQTKETNRSVLKISRTMKRKRLDNFKAWRDQMKKEGKIKSSYPPFKKDARLAECIGVILGDGNISVFPRTERLIISSNSRNTGFIRRYEQLIADIFGKRPALMKMKAKQCIRITLYEKMISKRLGIPTGSRKEIKFSLPAWIKRNNKVLISFLRGLYEAEGSFCVHKPTSTYKLFFSNKNDSLLHVVYEGMTYLGFHPNRSGYRVQISRRAEVMEAINTIGFRKYYLDPA